MTTMPLVVAGGLALQTLHAVAADPSAAYAKVPQKTVQPVYQFFKPKLFFQGKQVNTPMNYNIDRVGQISSRPWTQTVGWPAPSLFVDDQVFEPDFNLFWAGNPPD